MESAGTQEKNDALALMQQTLARLDGRELAIKQRPGWVAVPHETGGDFSTQDARRIAAAAAGTPRQASLVKTRTGERHCSQ
jgi:hypothetical protein